MEETKAKNDELAFSQMSVALASTGWELYTNKADKIVAKRNIGVNGYIAIALIVLLNVIGTAAVLLWIGLSSGEYLTIEPGGERAVARVSANKFTSYVDNAGELVSLIQRNYSGFRIGFMQALVIGLATWVVYFIIIFNVT